MKERRKEGRKKYKGQNIQRKGRQSNNKEENKKSIMRGLVKHIKKEGTN